MYRRFAAHFLLISLILYVISAIIGALLSLAGIGGGIAAAIVNLFFMFLLQAALVKAVQDVRDGRVDLNLSETIRAALPFVLPVAGAGILAAIGIAIGFVLIIVPGLILLTFWSLIVPSIVLGGVPAMGSFGASWRTVRGHAWNVFGTYVLVWLIYLAFEIVLSLIFVALSGWLRSGISGVVSGTLVAPFIAIVVSLIWYRLTAVHQGGRPRGTARRACRSRATRPRRLAATGLGPRMGTATSRPSTAASPGVTLVASPAGTGTCPVTTRRRPGRTTRRRPATDHPGRRRRDRRLRRQSRAPGPRRRLRRATRGRTPPGPIPRPPTAVRAGVTPARTTRCRPGRTELADWAS